MATMKKTLLEIVQDILNSMHSDKVSSITDTEEAETVASIVENVYYSLINTRYFPEHYEMFRLTPASNNLYPTTFTIPDNVGRVDWIKYNVNETDGEVSMRTIDWLSPEEFSHRMYQLNSESTDVDSLTDINTGVPILVWNNRMPRCYTSFDDKTIIMDSYKSTVDDTLQGSKTVAWGRILPTFTISDTFTPDLDAEGFPYLIAEAKSMAHSNLLKAVDQKVEQQARRQKVFIQNDKLRTGERSGLRNYGRN